MYHNAQLNWTLADDLLALLLQMERAELVVTPKGGNCGDSIRLSITKQGPRARLPLPDEVVSVRYQLAGQFRCHPHSRDKGRELKKLWQEFAVPPWVREKIGFVFYGEELVMAIGLWVEKNFSVESNGLGLLVDREI